ncbi:hypothetical protein [Rhizomonospora bruguierae]|uniref:hypothetical protein n=1 Tax=Rhizomonospora bruguierae TaxID=1581705 RepID=UPI001BCBB340|nr:hypothetical protein [Micromonospora sp. NBRC 107566]
MLAIAGFPTAAWADYRVPISGDTWSDSGVWYTSATWRTVSFADGPYVSINISKAPKLRSGSPDYIKWRIKVTDDGPTYAINQTASTYTDLGYYGPPGTQFRNKFARGTTCSNCDHSFSGRMTY